MVSHGDSGGPSFLANLVVGVHSSIGYVVPDTDIDSTLFNASFGEIFGDTRVGPSAEWIESVLTPEPGPFVLFGLGLAGIAAIPRRRSS